MGPWAYDSALPSKPTSSLTFRKKIRSKYYLSPSKTRIKIPKKKKQKKKPTAKTYSRTTSNKKTTKNNKNEKKKDFTKKKRKF